MSGQRSGPELIEAYLEGDLDVEANEHLLAWLRQDPARVRELVEAARLHNDLRNAIRARVARTSSAVRREVGSDPRLSVRLAGRRRRWMVLLPVITAAAAAIIMVMLLSQSSREAGGPAPVMQVIAIVPGAGASPGLTPEGGDPVVLEIGARLRPGDHVVSRSATVTLRSLSDATRFELAPSATLSLSLAPAGGSLRVALDAGSLCAWVAKQPPGSSLSLETPHARVEVVGTEFLLSVESASTRLAVSEGTVRFTSLGDGAMTEVKAGGHAASYASATTVSTVRWKRGPNADPKLFPLGVWAQDPAHAARCRQAGISCYVGLPPGALDEQLAALRAAGMTLVCNASEAALAHADDPTIVAWIGAVRPDDAPDAGSGGLSDRISTIGAGEHTPTPPAAVVARYRDLVARDASRPVLLCLGQGVAWDGWYGRGTRAEHPDDYPQYLDGGDIAAFGIDPLGNRAIAGQLWQVGAGVERLRRWNPRKSDWCIVSCGRAHSDAAPTAAQLRSEVWLALIGGADGIVYSTAPAAGVVTVGPTIFDDAALLASMTDIDRRIATLAPVLNSPSLPPVAVSSAKAAVPVVTMLKAAGTTRYLFAAASRDGATTATFTLPDLRPGDAIEVLDEDRRLVAVDGHFADDFAAYGVHLYALRPTAEEKTP